MQDTKLLQLNQQGIIPGPGETEEAFFLRADYCEKLRVHFPHLIPGDMESIAAYDDALSISRRCFDISPVWIPLFFSNYQLRLWQGGCAWIFQQTDDAPTSAFFQLRRSFRANPNYLGIYHRDEIIAHETAHVGRMMFQEPKYEELLAYQTATSSFRRWFGPLIQSSYESMFFVLLLFFAIAFDLYALAYDSAFDATLWFKLLPLAVFLYALYRLYRKQKTYAQAKSHLQQITPHADAILYRLTDREIDAFARMDPQAILDFAGKQTELRWRLIHLAYFQRPSDT